VFDAGIALGTRRFACSSRHGRERILHQSRCPAGKAIHQSRSHHVLVQFLCAQLLISERVRSKRKRRGQSQVSERHDDGIASAFGADMADDAAFIAEVRYIGDGLNRPDQNRFLLSRQKTRQVWRQGGFKRQTLSARETDAPSFSGCPIWQARAESLLVIRRRTRIGIRLSRAISAGS
jgi:hypothetical protein